MIESTAIVAKLLQNTRVYDGIYLSFKLISLCNFKLKDKVQRKMHADTWARRTVHIFFEKKRAKNQRRRWKSIKQMHVPDNRNCYMYNLLIFQGQLPVFT